MPEAASNMDSVHVPQGQCSSSADIERQVHCVMCRELTSYEFGKWETATMRPISEVGTRNGITLLSRGCDSTSQRWPGLQQVVTGLSLRQCANDDSPVG